MHWPKKIHTREMLTKETPPNTFLMVRFKCCFSMNIVTVIQFVLKVFFIYLRDEPLENLWRGAKYQKNIRAREH